MSGAPLALQHNVLRLLRIPTTIADLAVLCNVSRRDIEACVEELRLRGEPIVAGNDGLHVTEDPAELEQYVDARRRRIASIYLGCRSLRRTARRMRERADLTLWGAA